MFKTLFFFCFYVNLYPKQFLPQSPNKEPKATHKNDFLFDALHQFSKVQPDQLATCIFLNKKNKTKQKLSQFAARGPDYGLKKGIKGS